MAMVSDLVDTLYMSNELAILLGGKRHLQHNGLPDSPSSRHMHTGVELFVQSRGEK